jgi:hypothetical protein
MIICLQISTGLILEMQSDASDGTLIKNCIGYGFDEKDLREQDVTQDDYKNMTLIQTPPRAQKPDRISILQSALINKGIISQSDLV